MLPVATVSVQNAVDTRDLGTATAAMQFFRQLATAALVALLGVFALGGGRAAMLASPDLASTMLVAMIAAYRQVFIFVAVSLGLSCLFLARMEARPLRSARRS